MGETQTEATRKKFPGYDFDDFDGCITAFQDEPSIDDPEAFCAWLDEEGAEALSDPNAEEVLAGLEVEFVSAVDRPAQDSEWLIAKSAEGYPDISDDDFPNHVEKNSDWSRTNQPLYIRKADGDDGEREAKQIAFAPVLVPKEADKDGDVIPKPSIEDAAHKYLAEYRKVDSDHDLREGKGTPVESWTLKNDTTFELPDGTESREYPKGTWVMGIKFDNETWSRVQDGELSGLSIYGGAKPIDANELLQGKGTDTQMTTKNDDGECPTCDVEAVEPEVAKSEDDVPDWFERAYKRDEDPCWEDYVMVGMKPDPNGDGQVPNCVPDGPDVEPNRMGSAGDDVVDAWNEYIEEKMSNDDDPGDTGQEKTDESQTKQVDAGSITGMLGKVGEAEDLTPDSSVKDFVMSLVQNDEVDEGEVRNMSVLLAEDGDGMGDDEDDDEDDDEEMASDDGTDDAGIDLDTDDGKSEDDADGDDVDKDTDGDDVEKSAGDDRIDQIASAVESLAGTVEDLQKKVDDEPWADKMSGDDDLSDRIAKDLTGTDDADVAREAIREQVAKNDDGGGPNVDYEGITEDATDDSSSTPDDDGGSKTSNHSKAANTRMTGAN